MTTRIREW